MVSGFRSRRASAYGIGLITAVLLALAVPGQASASDPCFSESTLRAMRAGPRAFCGRLAQTLKNNQPKMNRAYSPSKQRYIRYIIRRIATGEGAPVSKPATVTFVSLPFGNITKFAAKALAAVKTFVGGVSKVIPQTKFLRCGIFAGLVAIQDQLKRDSYTDILVDATFACLAAFIPLPGDKPPA